MSSYTLFPDDESRWHALQTRNPSADGFFVYAVRSTKIYCRPTCKARLARRANVSFYGDPGQARDAGFRACKRCKPDQGGLMPEEKAVQRIRAYVRECAAATSGGGGGGGDEEGRRKSLGQMAREVGLSKWHFHRVFKRCVGVTPVEFVRMQRTTRGGVGSETSTRSATATATGSVAACSTPSSGLGDVPWLDEAFLNGGMVINWEEELVTLSGDMSGNGNAGGDAMAMLGEDFTWADLLNWPEDGALLPQPT